MPFRKAKTIELHDANTAITLSGEGYGSTEPAARHAQASRAAFQVRLADIDSLAERFGLHPRRQVVGEQEAKLSLLKAYAEVPANQLGLEITSLECDVQAANLVDIRIAARWAGGSPETAAAVQMITYSGSFTIWWAEEPLTSVEELFAVAEAHPTIPVEEEAPASIGDGELDADVGVIPPKLEDRE